ncbi:Microtubule-associated protein TORTIFOLIA1 [Platanthera guangdongensis]|uniref:Microtubule-associated protein TORTIFOLIA1 n=1 Tax=Platanthera guangdongensis TaxID=2320717 RepID=A0ABR2M0N6_9ASPA
MANREEPEKVDGGDLQAKVSRKEDEKWVMFTGEGGQDAKPMSGNPPTQGWARRPRQPPEEAPRGGARPRCARESNLGACRRTRTLVGHRSAPWVHTLLGACKGAHTPVRTKVRGRARTVARTFVARVRAAGCALPALLCACGTPLCLSGCSRLPFCVGGSLVVLAHNLRGLRLLTSHYCFRSLYSCCIDPGRCQDVSLWQAPLSHWSFVPGDCCVASSLHLLPTPPKQPSFPPFTAAPAMANQHPSPQEIRHRVNHFMSKLSDRDTEFMAAAELSSIIPTLSADSLAPFISAVGDIRSTDKIPLRRHSLRLLSLLARSIPPSSLSPHLPRILAAAIRRLRDPDSSVRAALVDAVRSLAAAAPPTALVSTILRPLVDALFHEQDIHSQSVSALSISASLEECNRQGAADELSDFLLRLVPRLIKLARSPSFKAKHAVLALLGNATMSASGIGDTELRALVNCLLEFLRSQDWAAQMTSDGSCQITTTKRSSSVHSPYPSITRSKISTCKSPQPASSPVLTSKKMESNSKKNSKLVVLKKYSDRKSEIVLSDTPPYYNKPTAMERDAKIPQQGGLGNHGRARLEVKRTLFEKNWENKENGGSKSGARVAPFHESGLSEAMTETGVAGDHEEPKDDDLSLIRMQLVQIENQQSSLLNLLQRFMGSSQNGIHSLEARVRGIEIALDDMSRNIDASRGRGSNDDWGAKLCCRLPGAEILSSKFWRRAESSRPARLLFYKENQRFGPRGGFINPLAEANPQFAGTKFV